MSVLIDFYHAKPTHKGFTQFFEKHASWAFENIETFNERSKKSWWDSRCALDFAEDHRIVREIVDDYYERNLIKVENLEWLKGLRKYLLSHLKEEPTFDRKTGNEIDLDEHRVIRTYYNTIHGLGLHPVYQEIYVELGNLLAGADSELARSLARTTKKPIKCGQCGKVFEMSKRAPVQIYCSDACRMKAYRKRKKVSKSL